MRKVKLILLLLTIMAGANACAVPRKPIISSYELVDLMMPNGEAINVRLADTAEKMKQGLSYIEDMKGFDGMLFVYNSPKRAIYWMKEMLFPLDIVFLDENKQIMQIEKSEQPCPKKGDCPYIIASTDNIKYVLELPAGKAEEMNLSPGAYIK